MLNANDFKKKQSLLLFTNRGDKISFSNDNIVIKDSSGKIKFQATCYRIFMICVVGNVSITSGLVQRSKKFGFSLCLDVYKRQVSVYPQDYDRNFVRIHAAYVYFPQNGGSSELCG